ncbi:MAG TPA: hypothetical protein VNZ47_01135 [Candidatus Dormibacteraeota bacterium]|jgi:hypothetical protein|nr:hypothetical protein [Candidatus Dormibacteraeota bacterium]
MRIIPDQLNSRNLVPFKKRQGKYNIPGMARENQVSMDSVDNDLSPEERGYIRHYLGYADALIRSAEENAPPGLREGDFIESATSRREDFGQPTPEATNEPGSDKKDASEKAA